MLNDLTYQSAVAAAVRAPSVHNTQPWLFHRDGDRVELRADLHRWLPQEDPLKRELLLSCGGALRHLFLGLRANGYAVRTDLMPDPSDPELLAVATVIGARAITLPEMQLFAALWTRHSERARFRPDPVSDEVVTELRRIAESEGCFLHVVAGDGLILLASLSSHAEHVLETDPALVEEQRAWTTSVPHPREGVPARDDSARGADVPLRRFSLGATESTTARDSDPPFPEKPLLAVLSTDEDRPESWLTCGWALSDLLLTLESNGLSASPLTQVIELPGLRARLTGGLGLQGHPQVILRIGVPAGPSARVTGRRAVTDVLA